MKHLPYFFLIQVTADAKAMYSGAGAQLFDMVAGELEGDFGEDGTVMQLLQICIQIGGYVVMPVMKAMEASGAKAAKKAEEAAKNAQAKANQMQTDAQNKANQMKNDAQNKMNEMQNEAQNKMNNAKGMVDASVKNLEEGAANTANNAANNAGGWCWSSGNKAAKMAAKGSSLVSPAGGGSDLDADIANTESQLNADEQKLLDSGDRSGPPEKLDILKECPGWRRLLAIHKKVLSNTYIRYISFFCLLWMLPGDPFFASSTDNWSLRDWLWVSVRGSTAFALIICVNFVHKHSSMGIVNGLLEHIQR